MDDMQVGKQVARFLRQAELTPAQLRQQYVAYKEKREEFEGGSVPAADMTALITPGVLLMLDLEEKMLADCIAERRAATAAAHRMMLVVGCVVVVLCTVVAVLAWG